MKTPLLSAQSDQNPEDLMPKSVPGDFLLCHTQDTVPCLQGHRTKAWGLKCKWFEPVGGRLGGQCQVCCHWGNDVGCVSVHWLRAHALPLGVGGAVLSCIADPIRKSMKATGPLPRTDTSAHSCHGWRLDKGTLWVASQALPDLGPRCRAITPQRENHGGAVSGGLLGAR